jgi:uroporphyrinogen III methyltransferase/synthase
MKKGKVTLVGGGIGNSSYMTIRGKEVLEKAEVVVFDRLLGEGVEDMIPETAEKINVGKKESHHPVPQNEINDILVEKALEGKNVVRLKGGDSYLFGRGGEEVAKLVENGIEFEVVPGITSAIAAPAFAGIPVTHRDCASSLHIITGHSKAGKKLDINYKACAEIGGTLVFLMGVKNLPDIASGLVENGMNEKTPCAVVERGGTPHQKSVVANLGNIADEVREKNIKSPAVIVVGEVCENHIKMDWFTKLPLFGKSIVIARPVKSAESLAKKLRALGAEVFVKPCIKTENIPLDVNYIKELLKNADCVAFTSPRGVVSVFETLFENGIDSRIFSDKKIAVVGKKTADELKRYGIIADVVPEKHNGGALAEAMTDVKNVLILRAENGAKEMTDILTERGISYKDIAVYKTIPVLPNVDGINPDYLIIASHSEIKAFSNTDIRCTAVCIGEKTAEKAESLGYETVVAKTQDDEGIINAVINYEKSSK